MSAGLAHDGGSNPSGTTNERDTMPDRDMIEQQKLAARRSVLHRLKLSLISATEAKHRLMGLGVEEKTATQRVAKVMHSVIIPE